MSFSKQIKKTYTLIEILFVVLVLGLLASITLPRFGGEFMDKMKVKTQGQKLISDLRRTRSLSITNNSDYTLTINSVSNQYAVYDSGGSQIGETKNFDSSVSLSGDKSFTFESLGNASIASDIGVSLAMGAIQADISVTTATGLIVMSGL